VFQSFAKHAAVPQVQQLYDQYTDIGSLQQLVAVSQHVADTEHLPLPSTTHAAPVISERNQRIQPKIMNVKI